MITNSKKLLYPAVLSVAILVAACHSKKEPAAKPKSNMLSAEGFLVQPKAFESSYSATGSLLPSEEIQILPEISGRITSITFKEGSHVSKGDVLITLFNADIKAQIQKSEAQIALQTKIKERQAKLLNIGGISQQDYETTEAQIASLNADVAYSKAQLARTVIRAPFSGRIGIRSVSTGAVISPTTVITTLQQGRTLKLDFTMPEQYKNEVAPGKTIRFTVTGSLDTFEAVTAAVDPAADATTRVIKARATVNNEKEKLVAGAFAHVIVPFERNTAALMIPTQSVIPTTRDKQVAIADGGKVKMSTVVIGTRTADMVEVISGLKAGDTVLTTGIMQAKNGMQVKVTKVAKG